MFLVVLVFGDTRDVTLARGRRSNPFWLVDDNHLGFGHFFDRVSGTFFTEAAFF